MVMPAELAIGFADGTISTVKLPVEMWNLGDRFVYRVPWNRRSRGRDRRAACATRHRSKQPLAAAWL
jgi:hypothetical protein